MVTAVDTAGIKQRIAAVMEGMETYFGPGGAKSIMLCRWPNTRQLLKNEPGEVEHKQNIHDPTALRQARAVIQKDKKDNFYLF